MLKQTISKDREIEGLIKNTFVINKTTIKYNNINRYKNTLLLCIYCVTDNLLSYSLQNYCVELLCKNRRNYEPYLWTS